jgi:hypothetical protein
VRKPEQDPGEIERRVAATLRIMAIAFWTFGYMIVAAMLFGFINMGGSSCAADRACEKSRSDASNFVLGVESVGYVGMTWLIFFRRRRS